MKSNSYIAVAVLDTGIYPHIDLKDRIIHFYDFTNSNTSWDGKRCYDDNGHGTHVAGIIAGSGYASDGKIHGIADKTNIVALKVLDKYGYGKSESVIDAIDYCIRNKEKYNIRIINISFGSRIKAISEERKLIESVEKAWADGIVVVAAAGNNGPEKSSITIPGISKKIITVGMMEKSVKYSGRGPAKGCVVKPDILCAGKDIISLSNVNNGYIKKSGTSMATAVISGSVAKYIIENDDCGLTPKIIKKKLKDCCNIMSNDKNTSGYGIFDMGRFMSN